MGNTPFKIYITEKLIKQGSFKKKKVHTQYKGDRIKVDWEMQLKKKILKWSSIQIDYSKIPAELINFYKNRFATKKHKNESRMPSKHRIRFF